MWSMPARDGGLDSGVEPFKGARVGACPTQSRLERRPPCTFVQLRHTRVIEIVPVTLAISAIASLGGFELRVAAGLANVGQLRRRR
jgi:hypothetical protein